MALTGLFLIIFLIVHLAGNLQLLKHDSGQSFNVYSQFMTHNPLIKTVSYLLYTFILVHSVWAIMLSAKNRGARGGQRYQVVKNSSPWTSRNMGIFGSVIFIFLVIHMGNFWAKMHFGNMGMVTYDGMEYKDLYTETIHIFSQGWYVGLYVISMLILGCHLWHGFASAFQTLGLNHVKYNPVIKFVGHAFAIIVPALFALIPILMFLSLN